MSSHLEYPRPAWCSTNSYAAFARGWMAAADDAARAQIANSLASESNLYLGSKLGDVAASTEVLARLPSELWKYTWGTISGAEAAGFMAGLQPEQQQGYAEHIEAAIVRNNGGPS